MFIRHGNWMRQYGKWIMAGVLALLIPGFVALFSQTGGTGGRRQTDLPTVRGKPVDAGAYQKAFNSVLAQHRMATGGKTPRSADFDNQVAQQAVMQMVMLQRAKQLGIRVTDDDVINDIRDQRTFRNDNGQFDPEAYRRFTISLNNVGVSQPQYEDIIRDQIAFTRLRSLVTAAAAVTPQQLKAEYDPTHEKVTIEYVEFIAADYHEPITISDEEAKTYFEQNKKDFLRPAQAKVRYVQFPSEEIKKSVTVTDDEVAQYYERNKARYVDAEKKQKPLDEVKEQIREELLSMRAQRAAGDRATEFTVKLVADPDAPRPDFTKFAADAGLTLHETGYFGPRDSITNVLAGVQFNQAAFALSHEVPFSDPVAGTDGYYVLEYLDHKDSELPTFEQAKEQVMDRLNHQHALAAVRKQGADSLAAIKHDMEAGKSFAEASEAQGLKANALEPFSLVDYVPTLPTEVPIRENAVGMVTNTTSVFFNSSKGGLFFYLKLRSPPDPEEFEKNKTRFTEAILERNRQALFDDWVSSLIRQEQVSLGRSRTQPAPAQPQPEPEPPPPAPASS